MADYTEFDEIGIPAAENITIRRSEDHDGQVVTIQYTRPNGDRHEVQVQSYGDPLAIFMRRDP